MTFVKTAAYQFQQLRLKKMAEEHDAEKVCGVVISRCWCVQSSTWECTAIPGSFGSGHRSTLGRWALCSAGTSRLSVPSVRLSTVGSQAFPVAGP